MSIKVNDLMKLKSLKKFELIAGESGLNNEINSICMADLELDDKLVPYANGFRRGSLVIASMRDQDSIKNMKFLDLIKALQRYQCVGLAYNNKMQKKPPKSVLDYCEKEGFPVFAFNPEEVYIENVIFEVMKAIHESSVSFSMEREFGRMLDGTAKGAEVVEIAMTINPDFQRNCTVTYLWPNNPDADFNPSKLARNFRVKGQDENTVASLVAFRDGLIVIYSMPRVNKKERDNFIKEVLTSMEVKDGVSVASSQEHLTYEELDKAFRECYQAYVVGQVENLQNVEYSDIGVYQLLIPHRNMPENGEFVRKYLKAMNREQLDTAIAFVLYGGDYDLVAEKMICHRNTVRYRISKIHEKTDPGATDFKFFENLSAAIKLYLISNV